MPFILKCEFNLHALVILDLGKEMEAIGSVYQGKTRTYLVLWKTNLIRGFQGCCPCDKFFWHAFSWFFQ